MERILRRCEVEEGMEVDMCDVKVDKRVCSGRR